MSRGWDVKGSRGRGGEDVVDANGERRRRGSGGLQEQAAVHAQATGVGEERVGTMTDVVVGELQSREGDWYVCLCLSR